MYEPLPRRISYRDAGIQKTEEAVRKIVKEDASQTDPERAKEANSRKKGYKSSDVSTSTEVTPVKPRVNKITEAVACLEES